MPRIHSIETMGALDGPGIRTVIFFQGCPMRCGYCHNADTFLAGGGTEWTVADLVAFCSRYQNYYGDDGGVTLSGGEPLAQGDEATKLLTALKAGGMHTALDTSGAVFVSAALTAADLVILDIKHTDPQQFLRLTGYPQDNLFRTLAFLKEQGKRFWVRQVIATGWTDSDRQVLALKEMASGAERIELLPYHSHGAHKWEKQGLRYPFQTVKPPSAETMRRLKELLQ